MNLLNILKKTRNKITRNLLYGKCEQCWIDKEKPKVIQCDCEFTIKDQVVII